MIGLFDSGSGGITVLEALRKVAPDADVVYFGDLKNAPYGSRSADELAELTRGGIEVLHRYGAEEIVSACNSVSFSVLAGAAGQDRVIEMSRPTARMLREKAGSRVLVLATEATIRSRLYQDALESIVEVDTLAMPGLANAIEIQQPESDIAQLVAALLGQKKGNRYDYLLLGCTHYPLAQHIIENEARPLFGDIGLIDPADCVAQTILERFDVSGKGTSLFLISEDSHAFRNRISPFFFNGPCELKVL